MITDSTQRIGQGINREMFAMRQDMAEHIFGNTSQLTKCPAIRKFRANQLAKFISIIGNAGVAKGYHNPPRKILRDSPKRQLDDLLTAQTSIRIEI